MKIIKLHVEKFGNLTDLSMDFSDGLNKVLKENGWGKSTLAAFLRVMFYGLEGKGIKKDISENDRTRYMPWDGGAFGGSITFEVKGKSYILSRNYTDKTKGKALLQDAGTLLESNDYSDNIGEELFGIDSDSFKKTAFIDHNNIRYLGANSKIASRVSDLPGMDDLDRFDQVDKMLSEYEVKYSDGRKTGALYKLNEEIHGIENELKKREKTKEELEEAKEEKGKKISAIQELAKERKELTAKLNSLSEERKIAANYKNYSVVKEEYLLREENYLQKKNAFAGYIPSDEEIRELSDFLRKAEEKKLLLRQSSDSDAEERLERLKRYFKDNPPTEEEVISLINSCGKMQKLTEENEILEHDVASAKNDINILEDRLLEGKKNLIQMEADITRIKEKDPFEVYSKTDDSGVNSVTAKTSFLFFAFAGIFLLCGVILVLLYFMIIRNLLIPGVGIMCLIAGFVLFILGSMRRKKEHALILSAERKLEKERETAAFKRQEKILNAEHETELLQTELNGCAERITADKEKIRLKNETINRNFTEIGEIENELKDFLNRFDISFSKADAENILFEMKNRIPEYRSLKIRESENEEIENRKKTESRDADNVLNSLYIKLGGANKNAPDYEEIREYIRKLNISLSEFRISETEYCAAKERKQNFLSEHPEFIQFEHSDTDTDRMTAANINISTEEEIADRYKRTEECISEIDAAKDTLKEEINRINHKIESLSRETDYYHNRSETLSDKMEEKEELEKNCSRMKLTREYLTKAKNRFVAKYMSPVKDRFDYYMDIMAHAGILPEDEYQIDAGLSLQKKELGTYHEIAYQSDGYSDMIGICMRFALLDVMYKQEKPMIIMDDPFVNLDANHLEGAKEFLETVAREYQILYFTCHEDRM